MDDYWIIVIPDGLLLQDTDFTILLGSLWKESVTFSWPSARRKGRQHDWRYLLATDVLIRRQLHSILSSDSILQFRLISCSLLFVAASLDIKSVVFLGLSLSDVSCQLFWIRYSSRDQTLRLSKQKEDISVGCRNKAYYFCYSKVMLIPEDLRTCQSKCAERCRCEVLRMQFWKLYVVS